MIGFLRIPGHNHDRVESDTLISMFPISTDDPIEYVKSVSIVEKQELYVKDMAECINFVTIASDPENDIAIIGKKCEGKLDRKKNREILVSQGYNLDHLFH